MAVGPNLLRRGAVYHWRRRIPSRLVPFIGSTHFRMSLNTKDSSEARRLGAQLDATAMDAFATCRPPRMTKAQLAALFKATLVQHKAKLDLMADIERGAPTISRSELLALELARGEAYALLAQQGADAFLGPDDEARLREKGFDTKGIMQVIEHLEALRNHHGIIVSEKTLARQVAATGATPTAVNFVRALPVYLKALSEALLTANDRYGSRQSDPLDFAALSKEAIAASSLGQEPPAHVNAIGSDKKDRTISSPPITEVEEIAAEPTVAVSDVRMDASVFVIGEKLVAKKVSAKSNAQLRAAPGEENEARAKAKGWDDKAVRQARSLYDLFSRFLTEEYGFSDLAQLRQRHLAAFEEFLRQLHPSFGRSPKDKVLTIAELRAVALQKGPKEGTLMPGTLNRHLTYLGQLLRHAKALGVQLVPELSTSELRSEQTDRGRNQRAVPSQSTIEKLVREPFFMGCASWQHPEKPGNLIFHRALYFGTLLSIYGGLRREEFCGLAPEDVVDDVSHPYLIIRSTRNRRIKNVQSARFLAIHPEAIRLGFLEYVRAMRNLGHQRLFAELYSPTTRSPLGDRYYDELRPSLDCCGLTPHQLRHFFNDALKQRKVSREFRADLLGHGGTGETDERYCDPVKIDLQLEILTTLPILTAHLQPSPIRLIPWVEKHEIAPWSRPVRRRPD